MTWQPTGLPQKIWSYSSEVAMELPRVMAEFMAQNGHGKFQWFKDPK